MFAVNSMVASCTGSINAVSLLAEFRHGRASVDVTDILIGFHVIFKRATGS